MRRVMIGTVLGLVTVTGCRGTTKAALSQTRETIPHESAAPVQPTAPVQTTAPVPSTILVTVGTASDTAVQPRPPLTRAQLIEFVHARTLDLQDTMDNVERCMSGLDRCSAGDRAAVGTFVISARLLESQFHIMELQSSTPSDLAALIDKTYDAATIVVNIAGAGWMPNEEPCQPSQQCEANIAAVHTAGGELLTVLESWPTPAK